MRTLFSIGVVVLATLAACSDADLDREDRKLALKSGGGGVSSRRGSAKSTAFLMVRKLKPYIRCINRGSRAVFRSRTRYLSWIKDKKVGPTCRERHKRGVTKLYSTMNCTTYLTRGNAKKPRLPKLEKAATAFVNAVRRLEPLLNEAYSYWTFRRYKRDRCAAGKAMHPKLMAAWRAAAKADSAMRALVEYHNSKLQARRLASIERAYGKTHPRYFRRKVIAEAKGLLAVARRQKRTKTPSIPALQAEQRNFAKILRAMNSGKPAVSAIGYVAFKARAKNLATAFDEFVERRSTRRPYSRSETRRLRGGAMGWLVKGSFARVLKRFNQLVDAFNRVRFRRG